MLSLKAELLRKQDEVNRAKTQSSITNFVPRKSNKSEKPVKKSTNKSKVFEFEDHAQLARSKKMLEAKAKYYEKMMKAGGSLNTDENCLVMFNQKYQANKYSSSAESDDDEFNGSSDYPEEDW